MYVSIVAPTFSTPPHPTKTYKYKQYTLFHLSLNTIFLRPDEFLKGSLTLYWRKKKKFLKRYNQNNGIIIIGFSIFVLRRKNIGSTKISMNTCTYRLSLYKFIFNHFTQGWLRQKIKQREEKNWTEEVNIYVLVFHVKWSRSHAYTCTHTHTHIKRERAKDILIDFFPEWKRRIVRKVICMRNNREQGKIKNRNEQSFIT